MLIPLDESLLHQTPWPFRMAGPSDTRFYDRYWFAAYDPQGQVGVMAGMGLYKNMGVTDGFVSVQIHGRQHNVRVSTESVGEGVEDSSVGPLSVSVLDPFRRLRVSLDDGDFPVTLDLEWTSVFPPLVEAHHLSVAEHRTVQDVTRYDQPGTWDGWLEVDGERIEVRSWVGFRDHSWGVRSGVGGFDSPRGSSIARSHLWACVATDEYVCQVSVKEDDSGFRTYLDGGIQYPAGSGRAPVRLRDEAHDISFVPGTRVYEHLRYDVTLEDDRRLTIEADPILLPWAFRGTGYDGGYHDGKGLGAARGELVEFDVYELTLTDDVTSDGRRVEPGHREQPGRARVDGFETIGHFPVIVFGGMTKYGLA